MVWNPGQSQLGRKVYRTLAGVNTKNMHLVTTSCRKCGSCNSHSKQQLQVGLCKSNEVYSVTRELLIYSIFTLTWDSTFAKNVSWKKMPPNILKRKKKSLVDSAVQKNNIQEDGKFRATDSRLYLFYIPRRLQTSVLARTAHEMTRTIRRY